MGLKWLSSRCWQNCIPYWRVHFLASSGFQQSTRFLTSPWAPFLKTSKAASWSFFQSHHLLILLCLPFPRSTVKWEGPMETSSIFSALDPLWSTWIIGVFWVVLQMKNTHQMENVNYLMAMSPQPQASWSLRTDNDNPCDNILFHIIRQSEIQQHWSLIWLLKTLLKIFWEI